MNAEEVIRRALEQGHVIAEPSGRYHLQVDGGPGAIDRAYEAAQVAGTYLESIGALTPNPSRAAKVVVNHDAGCPTIHERRIELCTCKRVDVVVTPIDLLHVQALERSGDYEHVDGKPIAVRRRWPDRDRRNDAGS